MKPVIEFIDANRERFVDELIEWVRIPSISSESACAGDVRRNAAHLAAGVGCVTCHGRVDQMDIVRAETPLSMGWCLECHRDPKPNLRPKDQITNMEWKPENAPAGWAPPDVHPPQHCSGCHR